MTPLPLEDPELAFACDFVGAANRLAQRIQEAMAAVTLSKGDLSPVTVADFAVQALAGYCFEKHLPEAMLVAEEDAAMLRTAEAAEVRALVTAHLADFTGPVTEEQVCAWVDRGGGSPGERFWTLDPIDGTKGYLRGGQYAVALALIVSGRPVLGALGCPNLGAGPQEMPGAGGIAAARRGGGAWFRAEGTAWSPLRVSERRKPAEARMLRSFESGHTNTSQIDELAAALGVSVAPVLMDSQAKYAVLAGGGAELLFRLLNPGKEHYKECIWDQAAGAILLEEAGGRISDLQGGPLDFGQGRKLTRNRGVFASNGWLHEAGLAALARVGAA